MFFYEGYHDRPDTLWSVDSHLLADTDFPSALAWVRDHAPTGACWSLGVVISPARPTTETELEVTWVVGADVLNMNPHDRTEAEERVAQEMLDRRDRVDLAR